MKSMAQVYAGKAIAGAAVLLVAAGLSSCAAPYPASPEVRTNKPSVTYRYLYDSELVDATRKAEDYCRPYDAWPRTSDIIKDPDGARTVVFVCDRPRVAVIGAPHTVVIEPVQRAMVVEPATRAVVVEQPRIVVVEPTPRTVLVEPAPRSTVSYLYRTDRELVDASQAADLYCQRSNLRPREMGVSNNADGSKTVQFTCN